MTRNQGAFLWMLRYCEGTAGPAGYRTMYGGGVFDAPPWEHPHRSVTAGGYTSTAAGAYQALFTTWQDFIRARGPHDFSPAAQDEFALWCIDRRGATADVEAGRLEVAIAKCAKEWASLPGSPYGQPTRDLAYCMEHYLSAGGQLAVDTQAPAPIEERGEPVPVGVVIGGADNSNAQTTGGAVPFVPIMLSLLPSILNLFAPRAQAALQKVTGQPPDVVQQFAASLFDKLGQLTGTTDPIQAAAAITKDPDAAKVADLQEHALDYLDKLSPIIEQIGKHEAAARQAERDAADSAGTRGRADKVDIAPRLVNQANWHFLAAMVALGVALCVQMYFADDHKPDSGLAALFGVMVYAVSRNTESPFRYRFGRQYESSAADLGTQLVQSTTTTTTKGK